MFLNINEYIDRQIYKTLENFLNKKDDVLEIGAGFGEYTFFISKFVNNLVALDIDEKKLNEIKRKIILKKIKNINPINCRAEKYISNKKFDKIIIIQSLGYISPDNFINIMKNNLKNEGSIYILDLTKSIVFTTRRKIKYVLNKNIPRANNYSNKDLQLISNYFKHYNYFFYGIFIFFLPILFYFPKKIRLKIYNKFDKFTFMKNLSFKYLLVCKQFTNK